MNRSELVDSLVAHHAPECAGTISMLMKGVPREGGKVSRTVMESLVREAFVGGVVAQWDAPYRSYERRRIVFKGGHELAEREGQVVRMRASTGETWHLMKNATLEELLAEGFTLRVEDAVAGRPLVLFKPE